MSNLLRAGLWRLKKSVPYKIALVLTVLTALYSVHYGKLVSSYSGTAYPLEHYAYDAGPFLALIIPVFTGLFIGTEYSDGAIRNKLVVGCPRRSVYLSTFLTVCIADLGLVAAWFLCILTGIPKFGMPKHGIAGLALSLLLAVLFTLSLSAIFTLLGMLITQKAVGAVAGIMLGLVMIFAGSFLYNNLCEPETVSQGVIINGELTLTEPTPNPHYVGEPKRSAYRAVLNSLPTGEAILMANFDDDNTLEIVDPEIMLLAPCIETLLLTAAGIVVFGKKDLR